MGSRMLVRQEYHTNLGMTELGEGHRYPLESNLKTTYLV